MVRNRKRSTWPRTRWTKILKISTVVLGTVAAAMPLPQGFVESVYSNTLYPWIQGSLTTITNLLPFSVGDLFIILAVIGIPGWWLVRLFKARKGERLHVAGRLALSSLVLLAIGILIFRFVWGFNYYRMPLAARLDYQESRLALEAVRDLRRNTILRLNQESDTVHTNAWPPDNAWREELDRSLELTLSQLGNTGITPAISKTSLFNSYMAAAGIEGFTNPFGLEMVVNNTLLPFEKPVLIAHESAHLAGYADESEASFIGIVACLQSQSPAVRYSGLISLYWLLPRSEGNQISAGPMPQLKSEVAGDLKAARERVERHVRPQISEIQWATYDKFLKANRVEAGVETYNHALKLLVGTRFEPDWKPVLRAN